MYTITLKVKINIYVKRNYFKESPLMDIVVLGNVIHYHFLKVLELNPMHLKDEEQQLNLRKRKAKALMKKRTKKKEIVTSWR